MESRENKILFELPIGNKPTIGRGGSLFVRRWCFALLDWEWPIRSARSYYVANRADIIGIDQIITTHTQTNGYVQTLDGIPGKSNVAFIS